MDGIRRRDVLKGSATLALAAGTAAFPRIGIIEAAAEASANFSFKQWQAAKHRDLDVRDFGRTRVTDDARNAFHARAEALSDQLPGPHRVRIAAFDAFTGNPSCVVSDNASACTGDWLDTASRHVRAVSAALTSDASAVPQFHPLPHVAETSSGARVVHLQQRHQGMPVFESAVTVRFDPAGKLMDFIGTVSGAACESSAQPRLTAEQAVLAVARHVGPPRFDESPARDAQGRRVNLLAVDLDGFTPRVCSVGAGPECPTVLERGPFGADIAASLTWFDHGDCLALAWRVVTTFEDFVAQYLTLVDADNGAILCCRQLVQNMSAECDRLECTRTFSGEVYRTSPAGPRETVPFPVPLADVAVHYDLHLPLPHDSRPLPDGFPFPWLPGGYRPVTLVDSPEPVTNFYPYSTKGNCGEVVIDRTGTPVLDPTGKPVLQPSYGNQAHWDAKQVVVTRSTGRYSSTLDTISNQTHVSFAPQNPSDPVQMQMNAFYAISFMHDVFYWLGFREADGNAQLFNFGRAGAENDAPMVLIRPVPGTFTYTPQDGHRPVMVLGPEPTTGRHDALDTTIVFHEYTHIVSNRLVGGPGVTDTLTQPQSQGLGEGWSDYVPCTVHRIDVVGAWAMNDPLGARGARYDANYPGTFGSLGIGWYVEKLFTGQIWAATLLEIARNTDRSVLLQVVVDSLKLMPKNPNFLQARDSTYTALDHLKQAGRVTTTQADSYRQAMKRAFARFGMGVDAGSTGNTLFDITPDFTLDGTSLKPPVKVIGLGGMSSDGKVAYVNGNDGSIWRYQFASHGWTEAAVRGVLERCTKMYWIGTDGTEAIAKREAAGHGRLVQANAQWSWTTFSPPSNFTGLTGTDIVGTSHDGKILWWAGADTSTNPPSAKFSKQSRDASGSWQSQSVTPGIVGPVVGVSSDGAIPVFWDSTNGHLKQWAANAVTDMGAPSDGSIINSSAVSMSDDVQSAFALTTQGRLWGLRKVQNAWRWTDLSANQTVPMQTLRASSDAGKVFLVGGDGHLWHVAWDGTNAATWRDLTAAGGAQAPKSFVRFDIAPDGSKAVVASKDFHLWQVVPSTSGATWTDLGTPT